MIIEHNEKSYHSSGTCFDDAHELICSGYFPRKDLDHVMIVHGIISDRLEPIQKYAHCWITFKGRVYEKRIEMPGNNPVVMNFSIEEFYQEFIVHDKTEYSINDIKIMGLKNPNITTGPYLEKYLKLCNDYSPASSLLRNQKSNQ